MLNLCNLLLSGTFCWLNNLRQIHSKVYWLPVAEKQKAHLEERFVISKQKVHWLLVFDPWNRSMIEQAHQIICQRRSWTMITGCRWMNSFVYFINKSTTGSKGGGGWGQQQGMKKEELQLFLWSPWFQGICIIKDSVCCCFFALSRPTFQSFNPQPAQN